MAITACEASVSRSSICRSVNGRTSVRRMPITPIAFASPGKYPFVRDLDPDSRPVPALKFERTLLEVRKTPAGRIELILRAGSETVTATHDTVVITIPFSVLRGVKLGATLDLPPSKLVAIQNLGYGTNSKMMIGFTGPMWLGLGSNGQSYSDLPNHQSTWETNPSRATSAHAVLTDYSGGDRGAQLNPAAVQDEATKFLGDLDTVYPGALAAAKLDGAGNFLAHLEHWTSNPLTNGAYTCNQPGYFTTIAGNEQKPVGNLFFAGEHTSSFYENRGFLEGAVQSGLRAAAEVLKAL